MCKTVGYLAFKYISEWYVKRIQYIFSSHVFSVILAVFKLLLSLLMLDWMRCVKGLRFHAPKRISLLAGFCSFADAFSCSQQRSKEQRNVMHFAPACMEWSRYSAFHLTWSPLWMMKYPWNAVHGNYATQYPISVVKENRPIYLKMKQL